MLKIENITFNIAALSTLTKEEFMEGNHCAHLDPERTWNRIQKEINGTEAVQEDASSPKKTSGRNRKNKKS